jgi:hypothetical protein
MCIERNVEDTFTLTPTFKGKETKKNSFNSDHNHTSLQLMTICLLSFVTIIRNAKRKRVKCSAMNTLKDTSSDYDIDYVIKSY